MSLLSALCRRAPTEPAEAAAALRLHLPGDPRRADVERFIHAVYRRRYGATVRAFAPALVSLADPDGAIVAAAGYRSAAAGPLYLERYLGEPVEEALAPHAGRPLSRREVVEIGHLAAGRAGAGRRLMVLLGPHLAQARFRWGVATLTLELRQLLARMGIAPLVLAPADPDLLAEEARQWGSYYEHQPVVLAAEIAPVLRRLAAGAVQAASAAEATAAQERGA
ncbi:MAG TPA: thermostable hemolysin [Ramlibacter sp.]|uniref:thermostable hemolysin n=1 Tax=Ramlibacter sp. TaxID=1917967 RepID=UPI002D7E87C9|nr:thermostable hemolysin [Ramlibacter sp.]HET8748872.1 thermostable hemolysin [Ramlibacter sp.]